MSEQNSKPPGKLNLADFERDSFGALFDFHRNAMELLRNSGLDDEKMELVSERIKHLLADATAEMQQTKDLKLAGPLESAFEEIKGLVDELSDPPGSGETGDDSVQREGEGV